MGVGVVHLLDPPNAREFFTTLKDGACDDSDLRLRRVFAGRGWQLTFWHGEAVANIHLLKREKKQVTLPAILRLRNLNPGFEFDVFESHIGERLGGDFATEDFFAAGKNHATLRDRQAKVFLKSKEYGSGLGLYISNLLATAMNCKVKLEKSEVGVGSIFSLTIPL